MWRSLLFVPGDKPAFLEKAIARGADALILDLEDGVAAQNKSEARALCAVAIPELSAAGAEVLVRINDSLRLTVADLEAVVISGLRAVVLPKAESADYVTRVSRLLEELETERGLREVAIIAQIESLRGLAMIDEIAACERVTGLALGTEDLAADAGMAALPHTLYGPAQQLVFSASRHDCIAYGFPASIADYSDLTLMEDAMIRAREMGFRGAFAIHPAQVPIMNEHFLPTAAEIEFALRVEAAFGDAANAGTGAIAIDGKMVDRPVALRAMRTLEIAKRFGRV